MKALALQFSYMNIKTYMTEKLFLTPHQVMKPLYARYSSHSKLIMLFSNN